MNVVRSVDILERAEHLIHLVDLATREIEDLDTKNALAAGLAAISDLIEQALTVTRSASAELCLNTSQAGHDDQAHHPDSMPGEV